MKKTEHVEYLLRQGKKTRELLELGFSKQVITRARRKLRQEKTSESIAADRSDPAAKRGPRPPAAPATAPLGIVEILTAVDRKLGELQDRLSAVETAQEGFASLEDVDARLAGTIGLGLRDRFKCQCGESGFVAMRIQCTKCGRLTWFGWYPKK